MDDSSAPIGPSTSPFSFVLIPHSESAEPQLQRYEGNSDEELRNTLRAYFAKVGGTMNEDQKQELLSSFKTRLESTKKKQEAEEAMLKKMKQQQENSSRVQEVDDDGNAKTEQKSAAAEDTTVKSDPINEANLLAHAVLSADDGNFEIIPVVLPTLNSKFRAISLYIDSTGAIKDLPINSRASKIAGREIRGDAFLLSNHDDPALDDWKRVDTDLEDYKKLYENPPGSLDVNNKSQNAAALAMREDMTKVVSEEDAQLALETLNKGREHFSKSEFEPAAENFFKTIQLLSARTDLLKNDEELQKSKTVAMSNYAACCLKLNKFGEAEKYCMYVLARDPTNEKAAYRLASAKLKLKDFEGAQSIINAVLNAYNTGEKDSSSAKGETNNTLPLWLSLDSECKKSEVEFKKQEQKKFSKMFG
jgi:tetratricopeptide (TPR) repeat protein